jgi:hypothetical protein
LATLVRTFLYVCLGLEQALEVVDVLVPAMNLYVLFGVLGGFLSRLTRTLKMDASPANTELETFCLPVKELNKTTTLKGSEVVQTPLATLTLTLGKNSFYIVASFCYLVFLPSRGQHGK